MFSNPVMLSLGLVALFGLSGCLFALYLIHKIRQDQEHDATSK
jgi:hypothetical protein